MHVKPTSGSPEGHNGCSSPQRGTIFGRLLGNSFEDGQISHVDLPSRRTGRAHILHAHIVCMHFKENIQITDDSGHETVQKPVFSRLDVGIKIIKNRHGHHHDRIHKWNESYHDDHRPYDHQYHHDHGRLVHGELVHECVRPPKPLKRKGRRKSGQKRFRSLISED